MGMDYSFLLYFNRQNLWEALQGVASISQPSPLPTLIVFPDHMLSIPLKGWGQDEKLLRHDAAEFGFMTSIYFPADAAIRNYLQRVSPEHFAAMSRESLLGLPVGYIYLTIYNNMVNFREKTWDPDLVLFDFSTPGTSMSLLFAESDSIRNRFIRLLEKYHGICGVLNLEDTGRVFWLNGKRMEREIPDAYMPPAEIEEFLRL